MAVIVDIETIPQALPALEKQMPPEILNPVMPPDLQNPEPPNFEEKAPAYSIPDLTKKLEAARETVAERSKAKPCPDDEKAERGRLALIESAKVSEKIAQDKLDAAHGKRSTWLREQKEKWDGKLAAERSKWEMTTKEARWKFIDNAALDPRLGHAKLLGLRELRDNGEEITQIFVWEPVKEQIQKVRAWLKLLPMVDGVRAWKGRALMVNEFQREDAMIAKFFEVWLSAMDPTGGDDAGSLMSRDPSLRPPCVTYYGNTFDFPFLYRRAWILGKPIVPRYRRGRYWDESRMLDLHDLWTFGDRQERSGGLDGLASALGFPGDKTGDGKSFHEWYNADPVEGIVYLINDLDMTEYCAAKTGAIPAGTPREK